MKEQQIDELQQVFREAQVDLPPGLKARLLAIPALDERPAYGYLRQLVPLLALVPGLVWVAIRFGGDLFGYLTELTRGLSLPALPRITAIREFTLPDLSQVPVLSELSLPAIPTITPLMAYVFTGAAALVIALAAGLYLWRESQLDLQYIGLLNRIR